MAQILKINQLQRLKKKLNVPGKIEMKSNHKLQSQKDLSTKKKQNKLK